MIRLLSNKELDSARWDALLAASPQGHYGAYSFFLDEVAPGWSALVLGDYEAVMPLVTRSKYGFDYICIPFFINQLGVFTALQRVSVELVDAFLQAIPKRYKFVELGLNASNRVGLKDFVMQERKGQYIDLTADYKTIAAHYSSNLQRNLRKAEKQQLLLNNQCTPLEVVTLFKDSRGEALGHFTEKEYVLLESVMLVLQKADMGFVRQCRNTDNELLAAAFFAHSNGRITYVKGGATAKGREAGAMHLIMDSVLREFAGKATTFDFDGSSVPSVERFNRNFTEQEYVFVTAKRNALPWWVRWMKS